jgi:hypothetical protein
MIRSTMYRATALTPVAFMAVTAAAEARSSWSWSTMATIALGFLA